MSSVAATAGTGSSQTTRQTASLASSGGSEVSRLLRPSGPSSFTPASGTGGQAASDTASLAATRTLFDLDDGDYGGDDDDDADGQSRPRVVDKGCDLFVVDASSDMHKTPLGSSMSAFRVAMSSIAGFMRSKILQNDSDTVGVLLYNTRDKKNSIDAAAVHVLFELDTPDVHRILKIESFASEESTFGTEIGSARQQCAFNEVFWIASTMFAKGAPRLARKRLFLITNNDNPVCLRDNPAIEDKMQLVATRTRLQDLRNVHVEVDVFAIDKSRTERFDFGRFYFKVANLILDAGPDIKAIPAEENFKELHSRVQLKEFRKRTAFRVPFCFGNDLEIGIKAYYVLMEAKKPTPVKLDSRTNREVESQTSLVCSVTGQMLLPADLKYYYELGGTKAVFTKDEVAAIKTFGTPGMLLFGFQDVSDLKPKHNLKPSLFVVPDESQYIGSSSLFAHLHKRMLDRKKMAICRLISRKGTAPRMVALVPQAAGIDPFGYAQHYGFNMIVLPFGDDIRSSTFTGDAAPSGLLDSFNQILRQVLDADHPFQLHDVPNPVIEKHQATLEALALGRDVIQEPVDRTLPNDEEIHNQVGELLLQFQAMCDDGVASPVATAAPAAGRRARAVDDNGGGGDDEQANAGSSAPTAKRARTAANPAAAGVPTLEYVRQQAQNGQLSKMTVAQLTQFLQSQNMQIHGRLKASLIAQVTDMLAE